MRLVLDLGEPLFISKDFIICCPMFSLWFIIVIPGFCSGFSGFELRYSDIKENISVNLSAQSGTISLSPMLMSFWPTKNGLSVYKGDEEANGLVLEGTVEVVNFALKSIQYLGYYLLICTHLIVSLV